MRDMPPIHPGAILLEAFFRPVGISHYRLAKDLSGPAMRIGKICNGKRGIRADSTLRLAHCFGTTVAFWTGRQTLYDTELVKMYLGDRLVKAVRVLVQVMVSPDTTASPGCSSQWLNWVSGCRVLVRRKA